MTDDACAPCGLARAERDGAMAIYELTDAARTLLASAAPALSS